MSDRIIAARYRRLAAGERSPRPRPALAIARWSLALAWRRRATRIALLACAFATFTAGISLVVAIVVERAAQAAPQGIALAGGGTLLSAQEILAGFVQAQFYLAAIALAVTAGGLVAEDRRGGAFDLYFARPLRLRDYALGKLGAALAVPALALVGGYAAIWGLAVGIAPPALRAELAWLIVPGLSGTVLAAMVLASTIVGLSALGERGRTVGVVYVLGWTILDNLGRALADRGVAVAGYLSPSRDLRTVMDALLGVGQPSLAAALLQLREAANASALLSALALLAFTALGLGALAWRLRREVLE